MKFVLIFGPQAVGKMTVGHELSKLTGLKLFHNHMSIELFHPFSGFSPETWRLTNLVRREFFESYARSDQYGLIFTYVWGFNLQSEWDYVQQTCDIFESRGAEVYFVELEADLDERLRRNETSFRLEQKPSKREVENSRNELLGSLDKYRLNSNPGEIVRENYVRINNTRMSAEETANRIREKFHL